MAGFDKDEIKNSLSIEQVADIVADLGGEPRMENGLFVAATICHNHPGEGSHKLYYYDNTKLFRCYTGCSDTFDIFELIIKIKKQQGEEWTLYNAVVYVINYFSLEIANDFSSEQVNPQEWKILSKWEANKIAEQKQQIVDLKFFDESIISNFPQPRILPWEREGITAAAIQSHNIRFDPAKNGIIIPHYDIEGRMVGIRIRTLVKEQEVYGKYRPAVIGKKMYNHPLSFNLYNINMSKDNITNVKTAIVFEGEKSTLLFASYFGQENDISVACCGSSLIAYQVKLLMSLGVKEIVIALDKQFKEVGDAEWKQWTEKLYAIHNKYGAYVQISYLFDKEDLLGYKDSPIDCGKDTFLDLYNRRILL